MEIGTRRVSSWKAGCTCALNLHATDPAQLDFALCTFQQQSCRMQEMKTHPKMMLLLQMTLSCNGENLRHFETVSLRNTCIPRHSHFGTLALQDPRTLRYLHSETLALRDTRTTRQSHSETLAHLDIRTPRDSHSKTLAFQDTLLSSFFLSSLHIV